MTGSLARGSAKAAVHCMGRWQHATAVTGRGPTAAQWPMAHAASASGRGRVREHDAGLSSSIIVYLLYALSFSIFFLQDGYASVTASLSADGLLAVCLGLRTDLRLFVYSSVCLSAHRMHAVHSFFRCFFRYDNYPLCLINCGGVGFVRLDLMSWSV